MTMEKVTFSNWDVKDHLKTPAEIDAYIRVAAEEGTPDALPDAFSDVFRAQGRENEALICAGLAEYLRSTTAKNAKTSLRRKKRNQVMKHPLTKTALALPLACAIFCATLSGCSRDSAPAPAEPSAPQVRSPEERMKDPEYVKKLNSIRDEQQEIAKRLAAARKELDAALAEDPESAKAKALQEKFNAVAKELETNRAKAILAVRDGMLSK